MGIDVHALNFLRFAAQGRPFGRTALLGRQEIQVPRALLDRLLPQCIGRRYGLYAEQLLIDSLGATTVDSFDNSDFEGANRIVDFNRPIELVDTYDTVFDGGCTEHIYNVPQALANTSRMCGIGGLILHVLPTNQFCGHGFWQMSPELFFSLYSTHNGYAATRVFVASLTDESHWYEVQRPSGGGRVNITSTSPLHVLVRTTKANPVLNFDVQQSDYVHAWKPSAQVSKTQLRKLKREKENASAPRRFAILSHRSRQISDRLRQFRKNNLRRNPSLTKIAVRALVKTS